MVAVDGRSGSGKSTIGERLAREAGADLVHFDDLLPGWEAMEPGPELIVECVLEPLAHGLNGRYPVMNWETLEYQGARDVSWTNRLVIEGVGAGARHVRPYLAASVWVDVPLPICQRRVEQRWDWPTYAPHRQQCITHESDYIAREQPSSRADVVLDGTFEHAEMLAITCDRIRR
ncbi:hypothetical protein ACWDUN_27230 [Mycobacterium sp. NPDC003323]